MNTARLPRTFIGARNPIAPLRYTATAMTNPAPNVEDDLRGDHALRVPRRQVENTRKSVRSRDLCSAEAEAASSTATLLKPAQRSADVLRENNQRRVAYHDGSL